MKIFIMALVSYESFQVLKMAYPATPKPSLTDDNYITLFQNGRLTLKRKDEPVVKKEAQTNETPEKKDGSVDSVKEESKPSKAEVEPPSSSSKNIPLPILEVPPRLPDPRGPMIPHQPIFDPWGRPVMIPPVDMHGMPFLPPPDYYTGRRHEDKPMRDPSPRKRTPPPAVLEISRESKRTRSRTPDRVVTVKERIGTRNEHDTRKSPNRKSPARKSSPRRTQNRRSPNRKSPRRSPTRKSPSKRSPVRRVSPKRSPPRRSGPKASSPKRSRSKTSPSRKRSPGKRNRSPAKRSPPRNKPSSAKLEDGDGTVFLDEGAYAELLNSLG